MRGFVFEADNSNDAVREHLALRLQNAVVPAELGLNRWLEEFRLAFKQPEGQAADLITFSNIAAAIAAYERLQIFVGLITTISASSTALFRQLICRSIPNLRLTNWSRTGLQVRRRSLPAGIAHPA